MKKNIVFILFAIILLTSCPSVANEPYVLDLSTPYILTLTNGEIKNLYITKSDINKLSVKFIEIAKNNGFSPEEIYEMLTFGWFMVFDPKMHPSIIEQLNEIDFNYAFIYDIQNNEMNYSIFHKLDYNQYKFYNKNMQVTE